MSEEVAVSDRDYGLREIILRVVRCTPVFVQSASADWAPDRGRDGSAWD